MNTENLQKRYDNVLTQYKQAVADYVGLLQFEDSAFVSVPKSAYVGTGSAGQSMATTLQECEASCASNTQCSGATFVSGQCNVRSGDAPLVPSSADSVALLPKRKHALLKMDELNAQLLELNTQIVQKLGNDRPLYEKVMLQTSEQQQLLLSNYQDLTRERVRIRGLLDQYQTLEETQREGDIQVTQNYYVYWLLLVFALGMVWMLVMVMPLPSLYGSETRTSPPSSSFMSAPLMAFVFILAVLGLRYVANTWWL